MKYFFLGKYDYFIEMILTSMRSLYISSFSQLEQKWIFTDLMGSGDDGTPTKPSKPTSTQVLILFCIFAVISYVDTNFFLVA